MSRRIFIDAMNVIRGNPSLAVLEEQRGTAAARSELLQLCRRFVDRQKNRAEYTVVFDGPGPGLHDVERVGALLVIYSGAKTADEIIVEKAQDALALGHRATIVSNDAELIAAGSSSIHSEDFYADLLHVPAKPKPPDHNEQAKQLIAQLVASGHLPPTAKSLVADLAQHLDFFSTSEISPNKLAKKLESFFRENSRPKPNPDPQKEFQRELKNALESFL